MAVVLLLVPRLARADVVPEPPEECPDGSEPASGHWCSYCNPLRCETDVDCEAGTACMQTSLCIAEQQCVWSGGSAVVDDVVGACFVGACPSGTCTVVSACAREGAGPEPDAGGPDGSPDVEVRRWGCGCDLGGEPGAPGGSFLQAVLAVCLGLRRRNAGEGR